MSNRNLIERFVYGNEHPGWNTLARDILVDGPDRERQIISLLNNQIEANKKIGTEIIKSNAISTQIISNEINSMTDSLTSSLQSMENNLSNTFITSMNNLGEQLSEAMFDAAGEITDAVYSVGKFLGAELVEIKWQMEQQSKTMGEVLKLLYNNRSNEARQFVQQGVRHYLFNEYEEAEIRFKKALEHDSTDFQALFNMGFIEIHKNNSEMAFKYFNKAINLPENLDKSLKEKALTALARLHYTQEDYKTAYITLKESLKIDDTDEKLYKSAVYAGLAGNEKELIETMNKLIDRNPQYFAKFASEFELGTFRNKVNGCLQERVEKLLDSINKMKTEFICHYNKIKSELDRSELLVAKKLDEFVTYLENRIIIEDLKYMELLNINKILNDIVSIKSEYDKIPKNFNTLGTATDRFNGLICNKSNDKNKLEKIISQYKLEEKGVENEQKALAKNLQFWNGNPISGKVPIVTGLTVIMIFIYVTSFIMETCGMRGHTSAAATIGKMIGGAIIAAPASVIGGAISFFVWGFVLTIVDIVVTGPISSCLNSKMLKVKKELETLKNKITKAESKCDKCDQEISKLSNEMNINRTGYNNFVKNLTEQIERILSSIKDFYVSPKVK